MVVAILGAYQDLHTCLSLEPDLCSESQAFALEHSRVPRTQDSWRPCNDGQGLNCVSSHQHTHTHTHTHTDIILTSVFGLLPGKGDLFGSDLSDDEVTVQSSCDVKSLTYCDLQCILLKSLKDTLIQYPEFQETFHEEIKHDLTYNLKEGFEEGEVSDHRNTTSVHCEQNTATGQRNEFSSSQTESQNLQRTIPRCFEFFR